MEMFLGDMSCEWKSANRRWFKLVSHQDLRNHLPGNEHISSQGIFQDDVPFAQVGYVRYLSFP